MNRIAPWLAIAVSLLALVIACLSLKRRDPSPVTPENAAAQPASGTPSPGTTGSTPRAILPAGLSSSEASGIATDAIATREREIVDRIWPRIAKFREMQHLKEVPKPAKLDEALNLFLDFTGEQETEDGKPRANQKELTVCRNQLKQIGIYFALFESKNRFYPASLDDIRTPDYIQDQKMLVCPFDKSGDTCSYEYMHPVRGDDEPPDMIMAYDKHIHPDGSRHVLYFSGMTSSLKEADFQKALGEQIARDREHLADEVVKARAAALDTSLSPEKKEAAQKRLRILESLTR